MLRIAYTPAAEKYFRKIKNQELKNAYQHAILAIRRDPTIGMEKSGDLKGIFFLTFITKARIMNWPIEFIRMKTAI